MSPPTVAQNTAALDNFIRQPVTKEMVSSLSQRASSVIRCEEVVAAAAPASNPRLPPTPPRTPPQDNAPRFTSNETPLPSLESFITSLVDKSHVQVSTLMSSLVYLNRLQKRLPPVAKGMRCTVHRIFLASLILAAKNLNDSSPKNKHWARYSCVPGYHGFGFSVTEVNLMEKQLLFLLDWDLRITNDDLFAEFEPFLAPIRAQQQRIQDKEEFARKAKLREREIAKQQQSRELASLHDLQRRHQLAMATYETCRQDFIQRQTPASSAVSSPASVAQHRRGSSRQLSFSPPSTADVPELARSATIDTLSSSSSIFSSSGTPATSVSPYIDASDELHTRSCAASPARIVHVRSSSQPLKVHQLSLESFDEEKPLKKVKTGSSLFSRFLGSSNDRFERVGTRARPQCLNVDNE